MFFPTISEQGHMNNVLSSCGGFLSLMKEHYLHVIQPHTVFSSD